MHLTQAVQVPQVVVEREMAAEVMATVAVAKGW